MTVAIYLQNQVSALLDGVHVIELLNMTDLQMISFHLVCIFPHLYARYS